MSKSILVLGANGFIGSHLIKYLVRHGKQVIGLSRGESAAAATDFESVICPANTPDDFLPLLRRSHTVIHAASISTPGLTAGQPLQELTGNLQPSLALLEALQQVPECALIYVSSGGALYNNYSAAATTEDSSIQPKSYYGAGKAAVEYFIHALHAQFKVPCTILRPSNLYGPGQKPRNGFGIIPTAFESISTSHPVTVWGDGSAIRDYLYIDDFLELCYSIAKAPQDGNRTINAASGNGVSLNELLNTIMNITGEKILIKFDTQRPVDANRIILDHHAATSLYGWRPQMSLTAGLNKTWEWYLSTHE